MPEEIKDVTITKELIMSLVQSKLPELVEKAFESSYDSPIKKAVDAAVKSQEGPIKDLVDGIMKDAISSPEFKQKLTDAVIARIIAVNLNTNR